MTWTLNQSSNEFTRGKRVITNHGKKGGEQYVLWEIIEMDVKIATGDKRMPWRFAKLEIPCRLLAMGSVDYCKNFIGD